MIAGPGVPAGVEAATWFAAIALVTAALAIAAAELARRGLDRAEGAARTRRPLVAVLATLTVVRLVTVAGFGLAGRLDLAVATYLLARTSDGLHAPLYRAWLNRELEPATRATALSAAGVADALGQVVGGPLLGLVAAALGMPAAFVVAALLLGPAAVLLARTWRREPPGSEGVA
jgi:DHA3 family tetracycline resistance protein-like MFS transporter